MAGNNEIGAKIVLAGDASGAEQAVRTVAGGVSTLVKETAAGDRAVAQLDKELRSLSPDRLQAIAGALEEVVSSGTHSGAMLENVKSRLAQVQGIQAEHAAKGDVGGQLLGQLSGELAGLAGRVPGLEAVGGALSALATGPAAAAAAAIAGIGAAVGVAEKSIDAFASKQERVFRLDTVLQQEGEFTDEIRAKYQALGAEYGRLTGQGGKWLDVITTLMERGKDVNDGNIRDYLEAIKDLSGELGGIPTGQHKYGSARSTAT